MPDLAERLSDARILMVDDEAANLELLQRILVPAGYTRLRTTTSPDEVPELCAAFDPDLILLDLLMPGTDGFEVLGRLRADGDGRYLPVLILTSDHSQEAKRRGLSAGAQDFLTKPLSPSEVRLRVRNLLETRFLHLALQDHNRLLEDRVRQRTEALERARLEILERLARAAEYRDDRTGAHTRRVGESAAAIARALGLPPEEVETIRRVAPLHDVGKIGIPDAILLSPGRLTDPEFEVMKSHTDIGGDLLSGSDSALLQCAESIARSHHEHWDGRGYPRGLSRGAIPLEGRIVAVADTFDALSHSRPYKPAWSVDESLDAIRAGAGSHFDPEVVDAFVSVMARHGAVRVAG